MLRFIEPYRKRWHDLRSKTLIKEVLVVEGKMDVVAINKAVEMLYNDEGEGCQVVALPDGKLGLVSCGTGTYNKDMRDLTAQRRAQPLPGCRSRSLLYTCSHRVAAPSASCVSWRACGA